MPATRAKALALLIAAVALGVLAAPSVAAAHLARQPAAEAAAPLTGPDLGVRRPVMIGVKAFSPTDVWGVGMQPTQSSTYGERTQTFAAHFDGSTWTPVPTVSRKYYNRLDSVDGLSSSDLWAVGVYEDRQLVPHPLAEHWDGSSWTAASLPDPGPDGGLLSSVAVDSRTDAWAVGYRSIASGATRPILDHWDGTSWTAVQPARARALHDLAAVTATSSSDVWIAGLGDHGYISEHWDGTSWTVTRMARPSVTFIAALAAVTAHDVWAVGWRHAGQPVSDLTCIEHWDGTSWSRIPSPNPGGSEISLSRVSGVSASDVWAVGNYWVDDRQRTLTEHWDGKRWSIVPSPNPRSNSAVYGVSQDSSDDAWLTGAKTLKGAAFVEHWDGSTWTASRPFS